MKLLIIDNYDSFTFNLVQYAEAFVEQLDVRRNDEISLDDVGNYDAIILSPGPGLPKDTGISQAVVKKYGATKKMLGVCMGMQLIAEVYGGKLRNLDEPLHGVAVETFQTEIPHNIFRDIPKSFPSGRYHSWVVDEDTLPAELQITARDVLGLPQAIKHTKYPISGVQFHPESVLTGYGRQMIENWVKYC